MLSILLAAAVALSPADDANVVKALQNLAQIHDLAAVNEARRLAGLGLVADPPLDPWGNPYRIDGGRIVSSGSDGKFEEGEPKHEQFTGTEGDVIFADGALVRSNRNWLADRATSDAARAALEAVRKSEMQEMLMRAPEMRELMMARMTATMMLQPNATKDAWGTPLRIDGTRIISAGADRVFDPMSWERPPQPDLGEDMIADGGQLTRVVDRKAYLEKHPPHVEPIPQPRDPELEGTRITPGGPVTAPVVLKRVEPHYSAAYRGGRIEGRVILETEIRADGTIGDVNVAKSAAPDLDQAAIEAVRQWTYKPAMRDGQPVPVVFHLTINFKLN